MHVVHATRVVALVAIVTLGAAACSGSSSKSSGANNKPATKSNELVVTPATQVIADTVPDGATRLHFETGPIDIIPGQNNIAYSRTIPQPKEDGYIVGISSNLRKADGTVPPVDVIHLHHGVWLNLSAKDATSPGLPERFYAAGEEKTRMLSAQGYGYPYKATDHWLLNYMLHNQLSKPDKIWVTYDLDFVPATSPLGKTLKPARPIWMDVQNGSIYPVFDVLQNTGHDGAFTYPDDAVNPYACTPEPARIGRNGKPRPARPCNSSPKNTWTVDRDGVLLGTAGHVHPGGLHDDLWLTRAGATGVAGHTKSAAPDTAHLFSSVATYWEPAGPVSWDVAMSATPDTWRVAVKKGDVMSISSTYDTKNASWYESMGIMVVWMADGNDAPDPFKTPVDVQGVLTHGHLPENNNHGGQPAPHDYSDMSKMPSHVVPSGTVLPIADFVYEGDMSNSASVPTVVQGGTLVFRNDDASRGIPHTISACVSPCDLSTGIAFPLENGQPRFDSGELGTGGAPASGKVSWTISTTNMAPGTYTYYCRIHPFMRGAFRVVGKS
jgi:plastocyanin